MKEFKGMFKELGFEMEDREINQWIESEFSDSGVPVLTDNEICDLVSHKVRAK